ncbi:hypothetical protein Poly41_62480 [Novipirellula artificiosorum]|uniref:Uncharacterized protein n=1 Tax=Novipirellula artificiosorum TaxID=2528016 RepID=A0A5C6D949_9BACT|nr:hypothetical protein Poly41_62480 [Novipirellula artificiosorum]
MGIIDNNPGDNRQQDHRGLSHLYLKLAANLALGIGDLECLCRCSNTRSGLLRMGPPLPSRRRFDPLLRPIAGCGPKRRRGGRGSIEPFFKKGNASGWQSDYWYW